MGPIVGGVVGGAGGLVLVLVIGFFLWRKVGHPDDEKHATGDDTYYRTQPIPYDYAPERPLPRNASANTSARSDPRPPFIGYAMQTTKSLKAMQEQQQQTLTSTHGASSSETLISSGRTASVGEPASAGSGMPTADAPLRDAVSSSDVHGLRREVEELRREMRNLRASSMEPPPTYHEEDT